MADTKFSALPAAAAAADADVLIGSQSGTVVQQTASALKTYMMAAPGAIGGTTPSTGAFTTISASGVITSTQATGTAPFTIASTTNVANLNASTLSGKTHADPGPIGSGTPSTGAFTTVSASGVITSTQATGTAPFTVASTTNVANLNASSLSGATMAAPGAIGGGTPAAGTFTVLTANTSAALTSPTLAAGSASAGSWPVLTPGSTVLTTAVAGTVETDATNVYMCTDAANRGIVPIEHFIRANSTRTFTSNTNFQAIFSSPAGGTLTLAVGVYEFAALIGMDTMSATNGNGKFSINNGGGATLTQVLMMMWGSDAAFDTVAAGGVHATAQATMTGNSVVSVSTATELLFSVRGTFNVSGAGTIIPSFAQTTASAAVVKVGSYFRCRRLGAQGVVSVGNWS